MNREIEDMALEMASEARTCLVEVECKDCGWYKMDCCPFVTYAKGLAEKGYRKSTRGEWVDHYKGKYANALYKCSICNNAAHINELTSKWILTPFFPHCGAKMKYESED